MRRCIVWRARRMAGRSLLGMKGVRCVRLILSRGSVHEVSVAKPCVRPGMFTFLVTTEIFCVCLRRLKEVSVKPLIFVALGLVGACAVGCDATSSTNTQSGTQGSGAAAGEGGAGGMGGSGGQSAGGGSSSSSSGNAGMGGGVLACVMDADCANDPGGSVCDVSTGKCVVCLPGTSTCGVDKYCDPMTKKCADGCLSNTDCGGITPICDPSTKLCAECVQDLDCPQGQICGSHTCFPGCSGQHPCMPGLSCCSSSCYDLGTDINNCGGCNKPCPSYPNADPTCTNGFCAMGACSAAFADCDKDTMNGCEWNVLQDGPCACEPGMTKSCYQGGPGTENVGPCKSGTQTCNAAGTSWGPCVGQILPKFDICANGIDEDCNGVIDDSSDADGDGWTQCGGDCCDSPVQGCSNPALVNPGAFEVVGNGVNDDCDMATSDSVAPPACSTTSKFTGLIALDVAQAIDLCQTTTANPPLLQKKWGVITSSFRNPDNTPPNAATLPIMTDRQAAILMNYGTGGIVPKKGPTMAGLSTGYMRDANDPGYPGVLDFHTNGLTSTPPPGYLAAHGGALPSSAGCSGSCISGSGANDGTDVRLTIRVPTNALSFSYQFKFISYEYMIYACSLYNDFYLALLQSSAMGIPADKSISFDGLGNPVSVNNGFFDVCQPMTCYTCPAGYGELAGTGMDNGGNGGATKWLTTQAPVVPGETMQIEFILFDVEDNNYDSVTLIDNFQWGLATTTVNTHE